MKYVRRCANIHAHQDRIMEEEGSKIGNNRKF